jgi:outer membrane protein OmpA-like peptidoglycan-associated protein
MGATVMTVPFAIPMAAKAQPVSGLYVGAGAGVNYRADQDLNSVTYGNSTSTFSSGSAKFKSDVGPVALGAIGWGFGNGLRVEVEGSYRDNKFTGLKGAGFGTTGTTGAGGNVNTYAGMVNAAYDFDYGWGVVPYIGAGVGYAYADLHNVNFYNTSAFSAHIDKGEGNFAYQGFAGLAVPIAMVPGLSLTVEGRFFGTLDDNKYSGWVQTYNKPATRVGESFNLGESYNASGLIGLRYAFNAAPLPAPVEPIVQPGVARSYLVFFDWDKANLTVRARQIISEAAHASTTVQYTRIEVNGYTDTSGTPRYNQGLSIRRAQAVAAELVRDGVPRAAISIQGFGETHLLVPTGPGVREPQNRRVEIVLK